MPKDLKGLYEAPKKLARPPAWVLDGANYRLQTPLMIDSVVVEGLELFCRASVNPQFRNAAFMLRCQNDKGDVVLLERVDWKPLGVQNNLGLGPPNLQFRNQPHSHVHSFDLNFIAAENRMKTANLPIAEPLAIDNLADEEAFIVAAKRFNILNEPQDFPRVPWENTLF